MIADRAADWDVRGPDVPRAIFPKGRVRFSLGTTMKREADRRRAVLDELRTSQEWDIIRAVQDGLITLPEVVRRMRQGGENALPELRSDVHSKRAGDVLTLEEEAKAYLEWYVRRRAPQSVRQVRSRLKRVLEQMVDGEQLGAMRIDALSAPLLERAIEQVSVAPASVHALLNAMSGLYRWLIAREKEQARTQGRVPRWTVNPAAAIERPERASTSVRPRTASADQVRLLLAGAQLYQLAYLRSFLHVGLRLTELTHTRFHDDLDVDRWEWSIQARGQNPECGCPQCLGPGWSPKSARGTRSFAVPTEPPALRETIAAYLEAFPCKPGEPVFRNPRTGRIWDDHAIQRDFRELCEAVGVTYGRTDGITIHTLRHTSITALVRAGVRESVIAALHGDTVETIVTTYVHLTPADLADAIRRGPAYA